MHRCSFSFCFVLLCLFLFAFSSLVFSKLPGSGLLYLSYINLDKFSIIIVSKFSSMALPFFPFWYFHYTYVTIFVVVPQSLYILFCFSVLSFSFVSFFSLFSFLFSLFKILNLSAFQFWRCLLTYPQGQRAFPHTCLVY